MQVRFDTAIPLCGPFMAKTYLSNLSSSAHYAEEISKRSFISTIRPTVHTSLSQKRVGRNHFEQRSFLKTMLMR